MTTKANAADLTAPGTVTAIDEEKLFVLSNPYKLDGRVSSHPIDARGYAPIQCYLLQEGDTSLLVGTGLTVHQDQILEQLGGLVGSSPRISYIPSGADFTRHCNVRPIADRFGLEFVYQLPLFDVPKNWLNFRPEFPSDASDGLRDTKAAIVRTGQPIALAPDGGRDMHVLIPPLRLLPTNWLYDEATRTLFTLDMFTWVWQPDAAGPWVITEDDDDPTTVETVRHALYDCRYWWLAGAETSRIRRSLADIFEQYPIENIAPEYGCALKGSSVVSRHYQLFDDLLAAAPSHPEQTVEVGKWTFAGAR
jgi:hypothetical protein